MLQVFPAYAISTGPAMRPLRSCPAMEPCKILNRKSRGGCAHTHCVVRWVDHRLMATKLECAQMPSVCGKAKSTTPAYNIRPGHAKGIGHCRPSRNSPIRQ